MKFLIDADKLGWLKMEFPTEDSFTEYMKEFKPKWPAEYNPEPDNKNPLHFPCTMIYEPGRLICYSDRNDAFWNFFFYDDEIKILEDE